MATTPARTRVIVMRRTPFVTTGSLILVVGALSARPADMSGQTPAPTIARLMAKPTSRSMRAETVAGLRRYGDCCSNDLMTVSR